MLEFLFRLKPKPADHCEGAAFAKSVDVGSGAGYNEKPGVCKHNIVRWEPRWDVELVAHACVKCEDRGGTDGVLEAVE